MPQRIALLVIDSRGIIRTVQPGPLDLEAIGTTTTRRASTVEPLDRLPRLVFRALRACGLVALSRRLPARWWLATIAPNGPSLPPARSYADACAAEIDYLNSTLTHLEN
jgi:hypothetical protein